MPTRRPSASTAIGGNSAATSGRFHKSQDSYNAVGQSHSHSLASLGTAVSPQHRIAQVLVNRLRNKLPCNSGIQLYILETDDATMKVVDALVDLSRDSLDFVAYSLSEQMDRLSKQKDANGEFSLEVLQSQLFLLKVLSVAMAARWSHDPRSASRSSTRQVRSPAPGSPLPSGSSKQSTQPSEYTPAPLWNEPPPLQEECAKYCLSVMVMFLRQTAFFDPNSVFTNRFSDLSLRDYEVVDPIAAVSSMDAILADESDKILPELKTRPSASSVKSYPNSIHTALPLAGLTTTYEKTHASLCKSSYSVNELISKHAGRVVLHISASNWDVVFNRLQGKIRQLSDRSASSIDSADTTDLHVLSYSILDKSRLMQVLNELSSLLVNMNLDTTMAVAVPLRIAIWNWIEYFPTDFNEAIRSRGALGGVPERVFDFFYARAQNGAERVIGCERFLWPTLTMLSCISADRLPYDVVPKTRGKSNKFFEDVMRHARNQTKLMDVALTCALEICRAAMHVTPDGEVPLRLVVYDVVHDIKASLISSVDGKPFYESNEDLDTAVYAEVLVTLFRFLPDEDSLPFFITCLEPERSEAVKACAVRACMTLIKERPVFPWQRSLDGLEGAAAHRLRDIFKTAGIIKQELDQYGKTRRIVSRPRAKRVPNVSLTERDSLLLGILSVWRASPAFLLTILEVGHDALTTMVKLWDTPIDPVVKVSAATTCRLAAEIAFILSTNDPRTPLMVGALKMCLPMTLLSLANNLLVARFDTELHRLWTGNALQLLELYLRKSDLEHVKEIQLDRDRIPALVLLELALLITLPSVDTNASHLAAQGLRLISHIERQPDSPPPPFPAEDVAKRHPVYEQLGDPKVMVLGRIVHQKRTRKLVRIICDTPYSGSGIAVWQECYYRWRSLNESILSEEDTDDMTIRGNHTTQDRRNQWQNLALFLASTSSFCLHDSIDLAYMSTIISPKLLPDHIRTLKSPLGILQSFMNSLVGHLVRDEKVISDTAREALGVELNAKMYHKLVPSLQDQFHKLQEERDASQVSSFVEQYIGLLRMIATNTKSGRDEVMGMDVSSVLHELAVWISRNAESVQIKILFCRLCDTICDFKSTLTLSKDMESRKNILNIVIDWIRIYDASSVEGVSAHAELNIAALRSIVRLLERLDLKLLDSGRGEEMSHFMYRLFTQYSNVLLRGLDICYADIPASDSSSEVGSIQKRIKTSQREAELRDLVITGLAHLVHANSEIGFKNCLPLAYSADGKKRAIFSHVFAKVIGQGTTFDTELHIKPLPKQSRLSELIKQPDMTLALAICDTCPPAEMDIMISVLLNLFDTRETLMRLFKLLITREINRTENATAFFRGNSICTRFVSAFARIHGYNYLRSLIIPLIKTMESMPSGYELDPAKAQGQDVNQNRRNIEFVAQSFLEILSSSQTILPMMFKEICAHIADQVSHVWPESKWAAVGAFMFLRFISPAIVAPETIDLEPPSESLRRGLMLIAKILQNLANNVFFGKEAHMTAMNDFLRKHVTSIARFLTEVNQSLDDESSDKDRPKEREKEESWLVPTSDDSDVIVLHRFFHKHADKIGKELLSSISKTSAENDASAINGKRAWDGLCTLLVDLGPPIDVPKLATLTKAYYPEYISLMARHAGRNTDAMSDFFYKVSRDEDDDVDYYVFRVPFIDLEALDIELLVFHVLKAIEQSDDTRNFCVIVDCTKFTISSELPIRWVKYCMEVVPMDIRLRISTGIILNPNAMTRSYLRRLYNIAGGATFCGEVKICSSITELLELCPESLLTHFSDLVHLENEAIEVFTDAEMKSSDGSMYGPVTLSIGTSHIRVVSSRRLPVTPSTLCRAIEIIPLTDVGSVYKISTSADLTDEFIIRRHKTGLTLFFTSPSRDAILKNIRGAKGRLKDAQMPPSERFSRFSNVAATLLQVGLLNIDIHDEELRTAAYDLLGAVCSYLKYDRNPIIASTAACVPGDLNDFSIQLSEQLAEYSPHLTLDFLSEVSIAMTPVEGHIDIPVAQRIACLQYLSPWIRNLPQFCSPTSPLYEKSGSRLRDCVRNLCEMSISSHELAPCSQKSIWNEMGKLDMSVIDVVLDELIRSAIDAGVTVHRCESIAFMIAAMSSLAVRGRLITRLRRVITKSSTTPTKSYLNSPGWGEVCVLLRLTLIAGYQSKNVTHNQLYVPELIHVSMLFAGVGILLVRKSVHGIIVNLLQALYVTRLEEGPAPELHALVQSLSHADTLRLFGLQRTTSTSEYSISDPLNDRENIDQQEKLADLFTRLLVAAAGSNADLLNVWRARCMSLATASAFQYSPIIQMRSFTALGRLATSLVDEEFLYQMLVALRTALLHTTEQDTLSITTMLRCFTHIIPVLTGLCRYLPQIFWLALAFIQSDHPAFYVEATALLQQTVEDMDIRGMFRDEAVSAVLLNHRSELEDVAVELDHTFGLSFDMNFSFSLARTVTKGVRQAIFQDSARSLLRALIFVTMHSQCRNESMNGYTEQIHPDALGYFLALVPLSTTVSSYRLLLRQCGITNLTYLLEDGDDSLDDEHAVPVVPIELLAVNDPTTALLVTTFVGVMIPSMQGNDAATAILYGILSDMSSVYPQTVAMAYGSFQDQIRDAFGNSTNPTIIKCASDILRVSMQDNTRFVSIRGSGSTLNTMEDASVHGPTGTHFGALEELGMAGLTNHSTFSPQPGQSMRIIEWIPELLSIITS